MIRLRDAVKIAATKLKTRKIRTALTVGISGILFAILLFGSLVVSGISKSIDDFSKIGFGSRYILQASNYEPNVFNPYEYIKDPAVIARAKALQAQLIAEKKLGAKQLQVEYDEKTEPAPTIKEDGSDSLNINSLGAQRALKEVENAQPKKDSIKFLKDLTKQYNPDHIYTQKYFSVISGSWTTMNNGAEDFSDKPKQPSYDTRSPDYDPLGMGATVMDQAMVKPFLLPASTWNPSSGRIPVIVSYRQAEKLLQLQPLESSAEVEDKLHRVAEIRKKSAGITIDTCYRNASSIEEIQDAKSQKKDIVTNTGKADYVAPKRIVDLPNPAECSAPIVKSDKRSAQEKKNDVNMVTFRQKYDDILPAKQTKVTFEIVGLANSFDSLDLVGGTIDGMVTQLVTPSLNGVWTIPKEFHDQLPADKQLNTVLSDEKHQSIEPSVPVIYAEFKDFNSALAMSKKYSCLNGCSGNVAVMPFGSGSITVAQIKESSLQYTFYALIVFMGIAIAIMAGTVGRALSDSRRETAVFRAIGARRLDISSIYALYAHFIAVRVILFAAIVAVIGALVVENLYAHHTTLSARLLTNAPESAQEVHFIGVNVPEILLIVAVIIGSALLSMIVPLLLALRRNPIKDMRDDT
jgi:hypothetical protein